MFLELYKRPSECREHYLQAYQRKQLPCVLSGSLGSRTAGVFHQSQPQRRNPELPWRIRSIFGWLRAMPTISIDEPSSDEFDPTLQHWSREEWFYMWSKGLEPRRIAKLCRVPYRKVYDHIRTRTIYKPELFGQRLMYHDQPALPRGGLRSQKPSWEERAAELAAFLQVNGRFPRGYMEGESSLYSFLQNQRRQFRAGKLIDFKKDQLNETVPGWLTPPKLEREHALWEARATEMETFLCETGRYPRYKTAVDSMESVLAVWLERQRYCHRRGKLKKPRERRLDETIPNWRSSCLDNQLRSMSTLRVETRLMGQ